MRCSFGMRYSWGFQDELKGHEMIYWGHEIFLEVCFWKLQDAFCGCEMIFGVTWCFGGHKMLYGVIRCFSGPQDNFWGHRMVFIQYACDWGLRDNRIIFGLRDECFGPRYAFLGLEMLFRVVKCF